MLTFDRMTKVNKRAVYGQKLNKKSWVFLQQDVLLGLALQEVVEGDFAELLDREVFREGDAAREERERVPVERLGVEPDGIGDG